MLLLQIRRDQRVRVEERESFLRFSGLQPEQLDVLNVFDQPVFKSEIIDNYNGLLIGGASEASVLEPELYPFIGSCLKLIRHCIEADVPVFASCFGFQLAVLALGGEILKDDDEFEMGTSLIRLTPAAEADPLLSHLPQEFYAVSVHRQKAMELPASCEPLGRTDHCLHAFRVRDKPFWAFQFHPELDCATLKERLAIYRDKYADNEDHFLEVLAGLQPTPEANTLPKIFVDAVLKARA